MKSWYAELAAMKGLGSETEKPGSLAGLHEARRLHLGQFFTPEKLVSLCWRIIDAPLREATRNGGRAAIFDNSVGSGRMFALATPERHTLFGCDVHEPALLALAEAAGKAGFDHELRVAGMESIRARGMDAALINPPFSLRLDSPVLEPFECTTFGRYGPCTTAVSHAYALDQALEAAQIVVAILPATYAAERAAKREARLAAVLRLPGGLFRDENTEIRVWMLVYDSEARQAPVELTLESLDEPVPQLGLTWIPHRTRPSLRSIEVEDDGPVITLPVTGIAKVRIGHDGRKLKLKFSCGLIKARVLNAVYRERIAGKGPEGWRYPNGLDYIGQYAMDLEAHIAGGEPFGSLRDLGKRIEAAGAEPVFDDGLLNHLRRRWRRSTRQAVPLRHVVWSEAADKEPGAPVAAKARVDHPVDPSVWISPVIKAGAVVQLRPMDGGCLSFSWAGKDYTVSEDEARKRFAIEDEGKAGGWVAVHKGMEARFPELAKATRARIRDSGVEGWLTWRYQVDDLVEALMKPRGIVLAWEPGLGKARFAVSYIVAAGVRHGLIVTEAYLIDEMQRELKTLGVPESEWQVIDSPSKLEALKRINVISYTRLRMPVPRKDRPEEMSACQTYAKRLRRRVAVVIADEGDCAAHMGSDRTRALWGLSAKRRVLSTGTPVPNYPRSTQPLMVWCSGDGTAAQPWGYRGALMEPALVKSAIGAQRGLDAYRTKFVTVVWCERRWMEDLEGGAKREIPRIQNLPEYRASLAPHVKRRLAREPDVAANFVIGEPERRVHEIDWDEGHLAHYLAVAEEFSEWFKRARADGRTNNLVALLARIGAVEIALNAPHRGTKFGAYTRGTSKDRFAIELLKKNTTAGHRTLLFAHHPETVTKLDRLLRQEGIESVVAHGGLTIKQRNEDITRGFREGDCSVLLATVGVLQAGVNLHMADRVLCFDRDWRAKVEEQAIRRTLRPQQKKQVVVDYLHVRGSLDEYQAQLVAFKRDAANAGLDWATPETDTVEFVHMDSLLLEFCERLAELKGVKAHELRQVLGAA